MTDTATTFAVGDRVRLSARPDWLGCVDAINSDGYVVAWDGWGTDRDSEVCADELERIDVDPEAPAVDAAVSASLAGTADLDTESTGAAAEPAPEEPPVPTVEDLAAQVATLTSRIDLLVRTAQAQRATNDGVFDCLLMLGVMPSPFPGERPTAFSTDRRPVDGTFRHIDGAPRTTSRVRVNVTKNTKGYQHEVTAEVTSEDPAETIPDLVAYLLDEADHKARCHITTAQYRDDNGLPGDDEVDPDQPF